MVGLVLVGVRSSSAERNGVKRSVLTFMLAKKLIEKIGRLFVYFRFLNRCFPSITDASVNPCSIRLIASSGVVATLHVYSPSCSFAMSCVYIIVVWIRLCPICCFVYSMSLVTS